MVFVVQKSTAAFGMPLTPLAAPSENQAHISEQGFIQAYVVPGNWNSFFSH